MSEGNSPTTHTLSTTPRYTAPPSGPPDQHNSVSMSLLVGSSVVSGGLGLLLGWFLWRKKAVNKILPLMRPVKGRVKLVLVVREDLSMSPGKIAAQCSHATLGCFQLAQESNPGLIESWESQGQTKIVLKAKSLQQLQELSEVADSFGLINYMIQDAGHTQVAPGTITVLGIGPGLSEEIDKVTGNLRLF